MAFTDLHEEIAETFARLEGQSYGLGFTNGYLVHRRATEDLQTPAQVRAYKTAWESKKRAAESPEARLRRQTADAQRSRARRSKCR